MHTSACGAAQPQLVVRLRWLRWHSTPYWQHDLHQSLPYNVHRSKGGKSSDRLLASARRLVRTPCTTSTGKRGYKRKAMMELLEQVRPRPRTVACHGLMSSGALSKHCLRLC